MMTFLSVPWPVLFHLFPATGHILLVTTIPAAFSIYPFVYIEELCACGFPSFILMKVNLSKFDLINSPMPFKYFFFACADKGKAH